MDPTPPPPARPQSRAEALAWLRRRQQEQAGQLTAHQRMERMVALLELWQHRAAPERGPDRDWLAYAAARRGRQLAASPDAPPE